MKLRVMQILYTLTHGGAERLGLTILDGNRDSVEGSVCGVFGNGGPLVEAIESLSLPHFSIDAGIVGKLNSWRKLYSLFKQEQVDVVHIQAGFLLFYVFVPAKLAGAKIVYTEHAKQSILQIPKLKYAIKLLSPWLDGMTSVSLNLQNFFVEHLGLNRKRVEHIPNGVDTERFRSDGGSVRGDMIPDDKVILGNVARMSDAKDHGNLLRAFKRVLKERDDVLLVLVGDGETRDDVESMIDEYGVRDAVLMLGRQEDIPSFLRAMDIFVLPSKREGAPISVIEAMACGVPAVATDVGGVSEILTDKVNGRVVQPEDDKALAEAILWLLNEPEKMDGFKKLGPETVRQMFSNKVMCQRYLDLYQRVAGQ